MNDTKTAEPAAKRTLVEEGTEFKGSFSSTCPILVRGRILGDVVAPSLEVSATGAVHGRVKVGQIRSQGELSGEIEADVVQLSGTVKDKTVVRAKSLEVKLSTAAGRMQVVFGECILDVGEAPSQEAAIASASREARVSASAPAAAPAPSAPVSGNGSTHRPPPPPRHSERAPVVDTPALASETTPERGAELGPGDNPGGVGVAVPAKPG